MQARNSFLRKWATPWQDFRCRKQAQISIHRKITRASLHDGLRSRRHGTRRRYRFRRRLRPKRDGGFGAELLIVAIPDYDSNALRPSAEEQCVVSIGFFGK